MNQTPQADPATGAERGAGLDVGLEDPLVDVEIHLEKFGRTTKHGHGSSRRGVQVLSEPFPRRSLAPARRPVVALLDTVLGEHRWFAAADDDPFWRDATDPRHGDDPWSPSARLPGAWSGTGGGLPTHFGHGTFIAGLVRQIAPEASVLSFPLMSYDGGKVESDLVVDAVDWLADRIQYAGPGDVDRVFVDVVNMSFGYYQRGPEDGPASDRQRAAINRLRGLGVCVVVSAGNEHRTDPHYPAAFAKEDGDSALAPMLGVAGLDPSGELAGYSNYGDWVSHQAVGSAVVSTLPPYEPVAWPEGGADGPPERGREIVDPNFGRTGFAQWSGTSFAAGTVSAELAAALTHVPLGPDAAARVARGHAAVNGLDPGRTYRPPTS
jgi:Subtilase family